MLNWDRAQQSYNDSKESKKQCCGTHAWGREGKERRTRKRKKQKKMKYFQIKLIHSDAVFRERKKRENRS